MLLPSYILQGLIVRGVIPNPNWMPEVMQRGAIFLGSQTKNFALTKNKKRGCPECFLEKVEGQFERDSIKKGGV